MVENQLSECVRLYRELRAKKKQLTEELKSKMSEIDAGMDLMNKHIHTQLNQLGVESVKTEHGTAFLNTTRRAVIADWDTFYAHVEKEGASHLLQKSCASRAVLESLDEGLEVPGTTVRSELTVGVRAPTATRK